MRINYIKLLVLIVFLSLVGCKKETNTTDNSFILINKDDYYIEYTALEIYRNAKTKKPLNGYYVIGNKITKWKNLM